MPVTELNDAVRRKQRIKVMKRAKNVLWVIKFVQGFVRFTLGLLFCVMVNNCICTWQMWSPKYYSTCREIPLLSFCQYIKKKICGAENIGGRYFRTSVSDRRRKWFTPEIFVKRTESQRRVKTGLQLCRKQLKAKSTLTGSKTLNNKNKKLSNVPIKYNKKKT